MNFDQEFDKMMMNWIGKFSCHQYFMNTVCHNRVIWDDQKEHSTWRLGKNDK